MPLVLLGNHHIPECVSIFVCVVNQVISILRDNQNGESISYVANM